MLISGVAPVSRIVAAGACTVVDNTEARHCFFGFDADIWPISCSMQVLMHTLRRQIICPPSKIGLDQLVS